MKETTGFTVLDASQIEEIESSGLDGIETRKIPDTLKKRVNWKMLEGPEVKEHEQ